MLEASRNWKDKDMDSVLETPQKCSLDKEDKKYRTTGKQIVVT
jgi:hypothetical protein